MVGTALHLHILLRDAPRVATLRWWWVLRVATLRCTASLNLIITTLHLTDTLAARHTYYSRVGGVGWRCGLVVWVAGG